ncbi:MAG: hypothetical protein HY260_01640, partial [Chloroflexi bacterium]|nr:hypothetical protein [Chloroflexota bacterium]
LGFAVPVSVGVKEAVAVGVPVSVGVTVSEFEEGRVEVGLAVAEGVSVAVAGVAGDASIWLDAGGAASVGVGDSPPWAKAGPGRAAGMTAIPAAPARRASPKALASQRR